MAIVGIYGVVVLGSALYGTPKHLPGVALGFPVLLDLERAAAALAILGAVLVVARLAWLGELPNQLGNIGYAAIERRVLALVRGEIAEILGRLNALEARQAE